MLFRKLIVIFYLDFLNKNTPARCFRIQEIKKNVSMNQTLSSKICNVPRKLFISDMGGWGDNIWWGHGGTVDFVFSSNLVHYGICNDT